MMLNSSAGDCGTRRTIIFRPSVDPIPIDANDRIDAAFEIILPDPLQSPNTYELVRGNANNVCNECGDVCDVVNVGSFTSNRLPVGMSECVRIKYKFVDADQWTIQDCFNRILHINTPNSKLVVAN